MEWEYLFTKFVWQNEEQIQFEFNRFGKDRWELVCIQKTDHYSVATFKRIKTSSHEADPFE